MTVRLFVYGTLVPGDVAWPVLEPWVVGTPQADTAVGRLYDTGRGYPGATFEAVYPPARGAEATVVHGATVVLHPGRVEAALAELDRYEGDEYERIAIRTGAGLDAETYAWTASLYDCRFVANGRWNP